MGQSLGLRVDTKRDEPIYRQIVDQVVARIQARTFPPGFRLPPTRILARDLATHRNTVARAYAELGTAGFVSSTVGKGTYVVEPPPEVARSVAPVATSAAMPWTSLLSRVARSDTLGRAERYARSVDSREVVNMARLQPSSDLLPDVQFRRCMERVLADRGANIMTYSPPEGILRLREEIAAELGMRGIPTAADILVTSGSQQALDLVARSLVNPGDVVLVDSTTYSGAIDIFSLSGARLVPVPSDDEAPRSWRWSGWLDLT